MKALTTALLLTASLSGCSLGEEECADRMDDTRSGNGQPDRTTLYTSDGGYRSESWHYPNKIVTFTSYDNECDVSVYSF